MRPPPHVVWRRQLILFGVPAAALTVGFVVAGLRGLLAALVACVALPIMAVIVAGPVARLVGGPRRKVGELRYAVDVAAHALVIDDDGADGARALMSLALVHLLLGRFAMGWQLSAHGAALLAALTAIAEAPGPVAGNDWIVRRSQLPQQEKRLTVWRDRLGISADASFTIGGPGIDPQHELNACLALARDAAADPSGAFAAALRELVAQWQRPPYEAKHRYLRRAARHLERR